MLFFIKKYKDKIKFWISKKGKRFLDIHIVEHCNLNCKSCAHFSPIAEPTYINLNDLEEMYKNLKPIYNRFFKSIHLIGGEPLLHPNIEEIIGLTRKYFPKTEIQIVTNGIKVLNMKKSFFEVCSTNSIVFYVSYYPISLNYKKVSDKLKKYGLKVIMSDKIENFCNYFLSKEGNRDALENYKNCDYGGYCIQLKDNKLFSCFQAAYIEHVNNYFGTNFSYKEGDFLDLKKPISKKTFKKFISNPIPFCRYCNMNIKCQTKWEHSKKEKKEWLLEKK